MHEERLDPACTRRRQLRLLEQLRQDDCDMAIVTRPEHVQWLCGVRFPWVLEAAAVLLADGRTVLAAPNREPEGAAAEEVVTFEAQSLSTLRNDQQERSLFALQRVLGTRLKARRIGTEFSRFPMHLAQHHAADWVNVEPTLHQLRRQKEADELRLIRRAIAGTGAMYARARDLVAPGVSELEVFNQLQVAATDDFGEPPTATGNDYQCGSPGGPPRAGRTARAGELYILDLGPAYRGYFADNCRTFSVGHATDQQYEAWNRLLRVFAHVESHVRPGASAQELYRAVQEMLRTAPLGEFTHHLGHGIGLFPHEAPYVNPNWDDHFQVGDVFTIEPGLYAPELQAGLRLEQNYLVTPTGVELLSPFPLEL